MARQLRCRPVLPHDILTQLNPDPSFDGNILFRLDLRLFFLLRYLK